MSDAWERERRQKEAALRKAVRDLLDHSGRVAAFIITLDPAVPNVVIAVGGRRDIASMLSGNLFGSDKPAQTDPA